MTNASPARRFDVNAIRFGVELETHVPANFPERIGSYYRPFPCQAPELAGWTLGRDSSISRPQGREDAEFASGILQGLDGVRAAANAARWIAANGGKVNASCGMHITISVPGMDADELARVLTLLAHHERGLYASTGTTRRENGTWCRSVKGAGKAESISRGARYQSVNLAKYHQGGRIELRLFAGTLNPTKVVAAILLVLGLVEVAMNGNKKTTWEWNAKPGTKPLGYVPNKPGRTELNRLFYRLGWTIGWRSGEDRRRKFGMDGMAYPQDGTSELPSMKDIKRELRRLAKQYDTTGRAI